MKKNKKKSNEKLYIFGTVLLLIVIFIYGMFLLTKNDTLFEDTTGDINVIAYLKAKNGIIYKIPFKFVVNTGG